MRKTRLKSEQRKLLFRRQPMRRKTKRALLPLRQERQREYAFWRAIMRAIMSTKQAISGSLTATFRAAKPFAAIPARLHARKMRKSFAADGKANSCMRSHSVREPTNSTFTLPKRDSRAKP